LVVPEHGSERLDTRNPTSIDANKVLELRDMGARIAQELGIARSSVYRMLDAGGAA
jgi:hypothetical protein